MFISCNHLIYQTSLLLFKLLLVFSGATTVAQSPASYTVVYGGKTYSSPRPYNVNVVYFVPKDIATDNTYQARLSAVLLAGQEFFRQNMVNNGYGSQTFGLSTEEGNATNVRIILINGQQNTSAYPYSSSSALRAEIDAYFTANPSQKTSEHFLIITAVPDPETADVPFYGTGKYCYALDYPTFNIQLIGQPTSQSRQFTKWYGGMMHELGHGLNLPHSQETKTEHTLYGTTLMSSGNYTLGQTPTFNNRAACAILNNSQTFASTTGKTYYNGNRSGLTKLQTGFTNGKLTVSGAFYSTRTVTDVNIYQDPYATPSQGYSKVAWSVSPTGNTFSVQMPVSELVTTTGAYNVQIELVLDNGETKLSSYSLSYANGVPTLTNIDFDDSVGCDALPTGWQFVHIGTATTPGIACYKAATGSCSLKNYLGHTSDASDVLPFVYTSLTGNGTIVARVTSVSTDFNTSGGIMLRNSLDPNASFVYASGLDTRGTFNLYRSTAGQNQTYTIAQTLALPLWVKLERTGNTIKSYYSTDGTTWTLYRTFSNLSLNTTLYAGVTAFGGGSTANLDNVSVSNGSVTTALPVELISVNAQLNPDKTVLLHWATATETNNRAFYVERSRDLLHFDTLAVVEGRGTVYAPSNYQLTDYKPFSGTNYYRLSQTDADGSQRAYRPVSVVVDGEATRLTVLPNPVQGRSFVVSQSGLADAQVSVVDVQGRSVMFRQERLDNDQVRITLGGSVTDGLYVVQSRQGQHTQAARIVVTNW